MLDLIYETQDSKKYVVYNKKETDVTDSVVLGMLSNNRIEGCLPFLQTQVDTQISYRYEVTDMEPVQNYLNGVVSKKQLFRIIEGILAAGEKLEEYMLDMTSAVLDTSCIYVSTVTGQVNLMILPIEFQEMSMEQFFRQMIFSVQYNQAEDCSYIAGLLTFFNGGTEFSAAAFSELLKKLQTGGKAYPTQAAGAAYAGQQSTQRPPRYGQPQVNQPGPQFGKQPQPGQNGPQFGQQPQPGQSGPQFGQQTQSGQNGPQFGQQTQSGQNGPRFGQQSQPGQNGPQFGQQAHMGQSSPQFGKQLQPGQMTSQSGQQPDLRNAQTVQSQQAQSNPARFGGMQIPPSQVSAEKQEAEKKGLFGKKPKKEKKAPETTGNTPASRPATSFRGIAIPGAEPEETARGGENSLDTDSASPLIPAQNVQIDTHAAKIQNFGETIDLKTFNQDTSLLSQNQIQMPVQESPCLIRKKNREVFRILKEVSKIGRSREQVDFFITNNSSVGRIHAVLYLRDGRVFLEDNASTNGTFLNERRISGQEELKPGSTVRFSDEEFEFRML
ncbi:MAG: FHA domain-containing protein [Clostridiales bacterium]|nr:FHA domain-containing protein [Clostridiales bacterium]